MKAGLEGEIENLESQIENVNAVLTQLEPLNDAGPNQILTAGSKNMFSTITEHQDEVYECEKYLKELARVSSKLKIDGNNLNLPEQLSEPTFVKIRQSMIEDSRKKMQSLKDRIQELAPYIEYQTQQRTNEPGFNETMLDMKADIEKMREELRVLEGQ